MNDLIRRQAAIDTLFELYEYQRDIDPTEAAELVRQGIYLAEKRIERLPSAQQWIPVNERLPEYGEQVVVNFRNEKIGRNRIGVSYCYVQKEGFFSDVPFEYKVVAWMPLPEPWRGEDEN